MKNRPVRYSVDANNCLCVDMGSEKLKPRGSFSTDQHNRLIYWLNEPSAWRKKYQFPDKIIFIGKWSLNGNHDLVLEIAQQPEKLTLKGEIISGEADKLVFQAQTIEKNGVNQVRFLKLSGTWFANESNQISFAVIQDNYPNNVLIFKGAWQINENQQISYTYQKVRLKRKTKELSTLIFSGFWQITEKNRLAYIFSRGTASRFDFRVQLETPNVYPKDGEIKYRIGIGARGLSPKGTVPDKVITFFGTWKINRNLGLNFEMGYADNKVHSLDFGTEVNLNKHDSVVFNLKNDAGKPLGISVIFTHKILF